ncbi:Outer membrane protein (porin) [Polaromonas sp. OV174]|uniref:porin n=1 Tax=Polaromonas sp. OV174 TaxID=1855300 RepID=UPI0008E53DAC|nr:porin [Polaromonas sp. OV174]SFC00613.1 Outer membrane protein (porin) [Polaromonas sp. OV174]
MKKTLIALAALGAMAGAAHAQSTVTLYGLLDANFQSYKTNIVGAGGVVQNITQTKIDSGGLNGSRWGLRVSEDIGGGMAVIGNVESGFDLSTGGSSQGALFGRRANVGISSGFGKLEIGRNTSSYDDVGADYTMMGATIFDPSGTNNGVAANATGVASLIGGHNTTWIGYNSRFNNSVKYTSPNFSGFSAGVMYAFGEDKTQANNASKTVSANLKYANGPLLVSGGYQSEAAQNSVGTLGGKPALENTLLSVAYDFGVAKVGAGFNRAKFKDFAVGKSLAAQKEWSLSVAVPLGATTISAGYAQSKGDDLGKSTGYGIQALYSLSKRSTLYAGAASSKTYDKLAALAPVGSNVGRTTTYGAGLRHTF